MTNRWNRAGKIAIWSESLPGNLAESGSKSVCGT
jgi:hypothetical protein